MLMMIDRSYFSLVEYTMILYHLSWRTI